MLALVFAAAVLAPSPDPVKLPAFTTWDGKSFAGIAIGTTENDLGKQVPKGKTVGPDPASVRIATEKKNWILAAILTETNNKGKVAGFTIDLEKNEPIQSLESLETDLGKADFTAYPATRFGDWSLRVWSSKGIVAAVSNGGRPLVQKILLAPPDVLVKTLDLWDRKETSIQNLPHLDVSGFDISASADPKNKNMEDDIEGYARRRARKLMDSDGGPGWQPTRDRGTRIRVSYSLKKDSKTTTLSGSLDVSYNGPLGNISCSQSESQTVDHDYRDRIESILDRMMDKLEQELSKKFERLAWQAEWRQFTGLCRPKA